MPRLALALSILLPALPARGQELVSDTRLEVELHAADPVLAGRGPSRAFEYVTGAAGKLYVWAASTDLDPFLRVTSADGSLVAEDDDSGGGTTPWIALEVEPGRALVVCVAAAFPGVAGQVELHLATARETAVTRAAAERALAELEQVGRASESGEREAARERLERVLAELEATEGAPDSRLVSDALARTGSAAHELGAMRTALRAWELALAHREPRLPPDHADLWQLRQRLGEALYVLGELRAAGALQQQVLDTLRRTRPSDDRELQIARLEVAGTLAALGDRRGARAIEEDVVQVFSRTLPDEHMDLLNARARLATTLHGLGELQVARDLYQQVVDAFDRTLPGDHLSLLVARSNLAAVLSGLGDFQAAHALQESALAGFVRRLGNDHPYVLGTRLNLANTRRELGDARGALALHEEVVAAYSRLLPPDHPSLQNAKRSLAQTLRELGELDRARLLQEEVLEVYSRTLAPDDRERLNVQVDLADTLHQVGDLAGAQDLGSQVTESLMRILPADHPDIQAARHNLAIVFRAQGDLHRAQALLEDVLAVRSRTLASDHRDLQSTRLTLAGVRQALGDLAGARELLEQAHGVLQRILPGDHRELQIVRSGLATVLRGQGELEAARSMQADALAALERTLPADHRDVQRARASLANIAMELGDLAAARELKEGVVEVYARTLPPGHPERVRAQGNLASTLSALGDLATARELEEGVLDSLSRTRSEDDPDLQRARTSLAITLESLGELEDARSLQEQALASLSRSLPADHPDVQGARINLSHMRWALGDLEGARELAAAAVEVCEQTLPSDHPNLREARHGLLWILCGQGDWNAALGQGLELAADLTGMLSGGALASSPREIEARALDARAAVDALVNVSAAEKTAEHVTNFDERVFALIETVRGVGLVGARALRAAARDPELARLRGEVQRRAQEISSLVLGGETGESLLIAVQAKESAERELVSRFGRDPGTTALMADFSAAALGTGLPARSAIVGYWCYGKAHGTPGHPSPASAHKSVLAYVVRPGRPLARVELGPLSEIAAAAEAWRSDVLAEVTRPAGRGIAAVSRERRDPERSSAELRTLVLDPLLPFLGDVDHLIVALDDVLHGVPFDALAGERGLVGETYRLEVRTSLWELLLEAHAGTGDGRLLAVGGIDYDAGTRAPDSDIDRSPPTAHAAPQRFEALPGARAETLEIARIFEQRAGAGAQLLAGTEATKAALLARAPSARFLHLATHGWFAPEGLASPAGSLRERAQLDMAWSTHGELVHALSPMVLCGLALAGANNSFGAGQLTAEELAALDLGECELAVLSACDTNVGIRSAGQGVASLQKALHMAGAQSVITSLWRVPDEATKELMIDFYRRMWIDEKPKAQALWEAKMELRDARGPDGGPLYSTRDWAAWVLTGAPD